MGNACQSSCWPQVHPLPRSNVFESFLAVSKPFHLASLLAESRGRGRVPSMVACYRRSLEACAACCQLREVSMLSCLWSLYLAWQPRVDNSPADACHAERGHIVTLWCLAAGWPPYICPRYESGVRKHCLFLITRGGHLRHACMHAMPMALSRQHSVRVSSVQSSHHIQSIQGTRRWLELHCAVSSAHN